MTTLVLGYDEAAHLAGFLARLHRWDPAAAVRLQVRGSALGVFAAPPMDCLAVVVVPLAEPLPAADPASTPGEPALDTVVSAGRVRDVIGDVSAPLGGARREVRVPDPIGPRPDLAVLPPMTGWLPGEKGIAGDVVPLVAAAVERFRTEAAAHPDAGPVGLQQLADSVWSAPGWGGIPLQVLHAARLLGFLGHDGLRIETATAAGWKRLATPGGQLFVRSGFRPAALTLSVVR